MKTYLMIVKIYNNIREEEYYEDDFIEMFSSFDRAKEYGLEWLENNLQNCHHNINKNINECIKDEEINIEFRIIEENIDYAENFDRVLKWNEEVEELLVYEPTHKEYILNQEGEITNIKLRYWQKQKDVIGNNCICIKPNDLEKEAGTKFKIGDIVKLVKPNVRFEDMSYNNYYDYNNIFVIRYLPRRSKKQKYFINTYVVSEILDEEYAPGIYRKEFHEEQMEKYDGIIEKNSPIDILSKIHKKEIQISQETWDSLKYGRISLREKDKNEKNYYKTVFGL